VNNDSDARSPAAKRLGEMLSPPPRRLTQEQIAKQLGVKQQAVSSWIKGRTKPGPVHRAALRRLYGIAEAEWLDREEQQQLERAVGGGSAPAAA
jgi:plasmid maintenance system antidote protein VapI